MIAPSQPGLPPPPFFSMRLVDEYEWVPQMRHYQSLFLRYRHAPAILAAMQERFGLRRVAESDPAPFSAESALLLSEWLHAQGDPHAMAWLAHTLDLGAGDGPVYYLRAHASMEQALDELTRLSPLFFPDAQFACEVVHDELRLSFQPMGFGKRLGVLLRYEAICVWLLRVIDDITGGKAQLLRMEWMNSDQSDEATVQDIVAVMPVIGASRFTLAYPASALKLHLPGASDTLRTHLAPLFEKLLVGRQHNNTLARRVAQWLDDQVQLHEPRLDLAAQALAMGASTLRRQLALEGCSFSDILASHRACIGIHDLIHGDDKADAIALQIGYADRNTFERAFRDWFGITPAHCRRAAKELLGSTRLFDWSAPSRFARQVPRLSWLRQEIHQLRPDWEAITQAVVEDPVLHARILGYFAMPAQGARSMQNIAADQLAALPRYALGNLIDSCVPLSMVDSDERCAMAWETSQRARAAVELIAPALGCPATESLRLAAACHNLGELLRPDDAGRHIEGVDISWLLLASWHVPPGVLQTLRNRHASDDPESTALNLAVAWARATHQHAAATDRASIEARLRQTCSPDILEALHAIRL